MSRLLLNPLRTIHRLLGLTAALLLAFIGTTGALAVFQHEIQRLLKPKLYIQSTIAAAVPGSIELPSVSRSIAQNAERFAGYSLVLVDFGTYDTHPVLLVGKREPGAAKSLPEEVMVYTDRATGEFRGLRELTIVDTLVELHTNLALGEVGIKVIGAAAIALFALVAIGLYIWWPGLGGLGRALRLHWNGPKLRTYYSWHTIFGASGAVLLAFSALSGFYLSYVDFSRSTIERLVPLTPYSWDVASGGLSGAAPLTPDVALARALLHVPGARPVSIDIPQDPTGVFRIKVHREGQNRPDGQTRLWIDQYNGRLLAIRDPDRFTSTETALSWIWPLHTGTGLGLPGRVIAMLSGLILTVVAIAGSMLWWRRRTSRRAIR